MCLGQFFNAVIIFSFKKLSVNYRDSRAKGKGAVKAKELLECDEGLSVKEIAQKRIKGYFQKDLRCLPHRLQNERQNKQSKNASSGNGRFGRNDYKGP